MRARGVLVAVVLAAFAVSVVGQDVLAEANTAYRRGDLRKAAELFEQAAGTEGDSLARADIRVKLAWTYFALKDRKRAEGSLAEALSDVPQLELPAGYFTPDFEALFARVRERLAEGLTAGPAPSEPTAASPGALAALRQRLAMAEDTAAAEALLPELHAIEQATPQSGVVEVLEVEAELFDRLGRGDEATALRGRVAALRAVSTTLPGNPVVPLDALLEGRRLIATGRPRDAAALMTGVLATLPSCVPALEVLGEAQLAAGLLDDAYSALRTALLGNEKPELLLTLGEVELRRDRLPGAREAFRRVVETDPGNDRGWSALGLLAARMGDTASATEALDRALAANGTLFQARVVRAQLALQAGDTGGAVQHLQRALQVRPDDPWANGWLGVAHLAAGALPAAGERLQAAVDAGQDAFSLHLAEVLRRQGRVDQALTVLARRDGDEAGVLRARCLLDLDRPDEAAAMIAELAARRPSDGRLHYLAAVAAHRQRAWKAAAEALGRARGQTGAPPFLDVAAAFARDTVAAQDLMDQALLTPPPAKP